MARSRWVGAGLLLATCAGGAVGGGWLCGGAWFAVRAHLRAGGGWADLPLDVAVTALAAGALVGCLGWLTLVTAASVLEALTGVSSALVRSVSPVVVRRTVAICCGLAVGAGSTALAAAEPVDLRGAGDVATRPAELLEGLPLPDRAAGVGPAPAVARRTSTPPSEPARSGDTTTPQAAPAARLRQAPAATDAVLPARSMRQRRPTYVVRSGDSLWSIGSRILRSRDAAEVDAAWRLLYRRNRAAVGEDPDLLRTGTVLHLPAALSSDSTNHRKDAS
jgi:hypothetical protein